MRLMMFIAFLLLACTGLAQRPAATADTVRDVYKGLLPCADCSSIATELTLIHEKHDGMGTFVLVERFIGKDTTAKHTTGDWTLHRGMAGNMNATVFDLYDRNKPDADSRYFLRLKDGNIKLLDKDLREMKGKANYLLKRER